MTRRSRFAVLVAVAALDVAGCTNNDAKKSDVVNAMLDAGLEPEQAECVGDGIDEEFRNDQELYNEVAAAADTDEFPEGTEDVVNDILTDCLGEGGASGG